MPFRWHECKYMCFYCEHHFTESSNLRLHLETHPDVDINGVLLRLMYTNYRIKLDVTEIWCTICNVELGSFEDYINHLAEDHELPFGKGVVDQFELFKLDDNEMHCLQCGQPFRHFSNLLTHVHKNHVISNQFLCEICGQGYGGKNAVLIHIKQAHHQQICRYCDQKFPSKYALYNHIGLHHDQERLKCPICPKAFPNRYLRKRHLALDHDFKKLQLFCDVCNKIFTRKNKLDLHKMKHYKEKNVPCEICGMIFLGVDSLSRHAETHDQYEYEGLINGGV
jgi:uncharacterized C2H2 Zn-finger protein